MIKVEHIETYGWEAAVRGLRNPMNSWEKSDSHYEIYGMEYYGFTVGENDLALMKKLVAAGTDHSKFMRMIGVSMDITAPLYWWKEADTYKVGTVCNSCSTMHTIHKKEFTLDDFSHEHLTEEDKSELLYYDGTETGFMVSPLSLLKITIDCLNNYRKRYLETDDKKWWWLMIQTLPSSYNQKRTYTMNYAVLRNMYHARKEHKLDCWRDFCKIMEEKLPYSELITM